MRMSLDVAEALLTVGELPREEVPLVAVALLESGTDTPAIREAAGLGSADLPEAHELFRRILRELGRTAPTVSDATRTISRHLASLALEPGANLRLVTSRGARLAAVSDYPPELMPFYRADDEWDCPHCGSNSQVERRLLQAAKELLK